MKKFYVGCVVCGVYASKVTKCYVWFGTEKKLIRHDGDDEYIEMNGKRYYPETEEPEKEEPITEEPKAEESKAEESKEPEPERPMAEEPRQAEPERPKAEDQKVEEPEIKRPNKEPKEQAKNKVKNQRTKERSKVKSGWDMESDRIPDIVPPQFSKPVDIALSVTAFVVAAAYWLGVWLRGSMIQAIYRIIDIVIVAGFWIAGMAKESRVWLPQVIDKTKLVVYGAIYKVMIGLVWAIKTTAILVYMVSIAIY